MLQDAKVAADAFTTMANMDSATAADLVAAATTIPITTTTKIKKKKSF